MIRKFIADKVSDFKWGKEPNQLIIEAEEISDEYHSMHELYQHRMALTIALCDAINEAMNNDSPNYMYKVYKARKHNDGTMFEGDYFVVMIINIVNGKQISYHYNLKYWDKFAIDEYEIAPDVYDGHTSKDTIERLMNL